MQDLTARAAVSALPELLLLQSFHPPVFGCFVSWLGCHQRVQLS